MAADIRNRPDCPVCLTGSAEFYAIGRDRLFKVAPGGFELYRCVNCRCIFQNPFPGPAQVADYYPAGYWWSEQGRETRGLSGFVGRLERAYREFVAMDHVRFLERCAHGTVAGERSLLDIGCGSGLFLSLAKKRGFDCHGMDLSARAVQIAREHYGIDAREGAIGDDLWKGRRFDFVTMFHVLEHMTDPAAALSYSITLLNPGGRLIVQVPNAASLQARVFGKRWYGLDVPRHIINFTPSGFRLLIGAAGFRIQDTARFSLRDNPASIASSLAPPLDPVGRYGRGVKSGGLAKAAMEFVYLGLVVASLPFALFESAVGLGGTIWVHARPTQPEGFS